LLWGGEGGEVYPFLREAHENIAVKRLVDVLHRSLKRSIRPPLPLPRLLQLETRHDQRLSYMLDRVTAVGEFFRQGGPVLTVPVLQRPPLIVLLPLTAG